MTPSISHNRPRSPAGVNTPSPNSSPERWNLSPYIPRIVVSSVNYTVTQIRDYFFDVKHPWKQMKYELGMKLIFETLPKEQCQKFVNRHESHSLKIRELLDLLQPILEGEKIDYRHQFSNFLCKLRELLQSEPFLESRKKWNNNDDSLEASCVRISSEMCICRFTQGHIFSFCQSVLRMILEDGRKNLGTLPEQLVLLPLSKRIEREFNEIKNAATQAPKIHTNKNKIKGTLNLGFDPHSGSNMPNVLYTLTTQNQKKIQILRIGTPTQQRDTYARMTWQGEAYINPEFEHFIWTLTHIKRQKFLYISLQEDVERTAMSESQRSKALRDLNTTYPENFILVIFSQDSDFYYQTGRHLEYKDADAFKSQFLIQMMTDETSGFYFPKEWKNNPKFFQKIQEALSAVHMDVFEGKDNLTVLERLDFIEIAYSRIALMILKIYSPEFFCFACKDSVDRAGKCNALMFYIILLMIGKENDAESLEILDVNLHSPAMLVKKQVMHHERRERFLAALRRLEDPKVQEKVKKWKEFFPISETIEVIKKPEQVLENEKE